MTFPPQFSPLGLLILAALIFHGMLWARNARFLARQWRTILAVVAVGEVWMAVQSESLGPAFTFDDEYKYYWSYIGHFIHSPFYCYAYAFGELLVLALVKKYEQEGEAFVPKYLEMLTAGGSQAPHILVGKLGVDVTDPEFWGLGLQLLDDMVAEAERLAG